jgi:Zn finger protein HypA/HybF involved in hydrogenase expression
MDWLKRLIQPRKCPECGGRLHKVIASDESFYQERADMSSSVRMSTTPSGYIRRIMFIPVYLECEKCDYRVRIRNIRTRA